MTEIKGLLLTAKEEEACLALIREMRKEKVFAVDFTGYVRIQAKTKIEAEEKFWNWVGDIQDNTRVDWSGTITDTPHFDRDCIEIE